MPVEKFSSLFNRMQREAVSDDTRFRMTDEKGIYVHRGISRIGFFGKAKQYAKERNQKEVDTGQGVWESLALEHGTEVADLILKNVLRCNRSDHRTAVDWKQMKQIKASLPEAIRRANLKQIQDSAVGLAADPERKFSDLQQVVSDNLDVFTSKALKDTQVYKYRSEQFHAMAAFALLDQMTGEFGYTRHDYDQFLNVLGISTSDFRKEDRQAQPRVTDGGVLREDTKAWMAKKIHEQFFKTGGLHQLNVESGDSRRIFSRQFEESIAPADEKLRILRDRFNDLMQVDAQEMAQGMAKAIGALRQIRGDAVSDQIQVRKENTASDKVDRLKCKIKNRNLVRNFVPGGRLFNRVCRQHDLNPKHLSVNERRYITHRLNTLAELASQQGQHVDGDWAQDQVGKMLREVNTRQQVESKSKLAPKASTVELHRQAAVAGDNFVKGLVDSNVVSPKELARSLTDFLFACNEYSQARGKSGSDEFHQCVNSFLLKALQRIPPSPHVDVMQNVSMLLQAMYLADADASVNRFSSLFGGWECAIDEHTAGMSRILENAVQQIALRNDTPRLNQDFQNLRNNNFRDTNRFVDQVRARNKEVFDLGRRHPVPTSLRQQAGADNDTLYDMADVILEAAKQRIELTDARNKALRTSDDIYDPNDIHDANQKGNQRVRASTVETIATDD